LTTRGHSEGLKIARFLMVLSSLSPLFIFWATRGIKLIPNCYFLAFCAFMVLVPNGFLCLRIGTARKLQDRRDLVIGDAEDSRDHLLVYLFAMLLPLYTMELDTWRALLTVLEALGFVAFLFWHLNLHYMNVMFAAFGYRVFTVHPPTDENPLSGRTSQVLITHRVSLSPGQHLVAYRLSDTVYFEVNP